LLPTRDIVQALNATRAEFARLFLQAQIDVPASGRFAAEAVSQNPDRDLAFEEALIFAGNRGFLPEFLSLVVRHKLEDGKIAKALAEQVVGDATLQAIRNAANGLPQPHLIWKGYADAMRWTCAVEVDGHIEGTGFLVGPNLVLTAWHVVRSLFKPTIQGDGKTIYTPIDGRKNIRFLFDDLLVLIAPGLLGPMRRLEVEADTAWYVVHSSCHSDELTDRLPSELSQLNDHWDYCVLRLKSLPGLERRWVQLEATAVCPQGKETVYLFHHPAGQPMRANTSVLSPFSAAHAAAQDLRFLHQMNSLPGSSGGPCFDKSFTLFGIHQGTWEKGPDGANRGVPITKIIQHLSNRGGLPNPEPDKVPLLRAGEGDYALPIVGRDDLQALVWRSLGKTEPPTLISIGGGLKSGKTFCLDIIAAMLPDGDHLKIVIEAEAISKKSAIDCARAICVTAGAVPSTVRPDEFASTGGAFQKDSLVLETMDALDKIRNRRKVWLMFKDLNTSPIDRTDVRDLLLLLFNQTKERDWFRIVLDGFKGDIPQQLARAGAYMAKPVTKDQILSFLQRFAASEDLPSHSAKTSAGTIFRRYEKAAEDRRLAELSEGVIDYMLEIQEEGSGG
jgi:hypothetical protein